MNQVNAATEDVRRPSAVVLMVVAAIALSVGFIGYGEMRAWGGTFGFTINNVILTFLVTIFVIGVQLSPAALIAMIAVPLMRKVPIFRRTLPAAGLVAFAVLAVYWKSEDPAAAFLMTAATFFGISFPLLAAAFISASGRNMRLPAIVFLTAVFVGCVLSESFIVADENAFRTEAARYPAAGPYRRARAWPNDSTDLVYLPGVGYSATGD